MKFIFLIAPVFTLFLVAYPCENLSDIEDWTSDGDCFVTYTMSGPVFQFSRVDQDPICIRPGTQGIYIWEDGKMDYGCKLPDSIEMREHLRAFIQEAAKEMENPRLERALSQLSEVVRSGRRDPYDGMVFSLTLREQLDSALARNSGLSDEEEVLLSFILKENLSDGDRIVLVELAKGKGVGLFQSYWAALILVEHFPGSESKKLLETAKERVISAHVDQEPKIQVRGGNEKTETDE